MSIDMALSMINGFQIKSIEDGYAFVYDASICSFLRSTTEPAGAVAGCLRVGLHNKRAQNSKYFSPYVKIYAALEHIPAHWHHGDLLVYLSTFQMMSSETQEQIAYRIGDVTKQLFPRTIKTKQPSQTRGTGVLRTVYWVPQSLLLRLRDLAPITERIRHLVAWVDKLPRVNCLVGSCTYCAMSLAHVGELEVEGKYSWLEHLRVECTSQQNPHLEQDFYFVCTCDRVWWIYAEMTACKRKYD